jgi:hypothetical protein
MAISIATSFGLEPASVIRGADQHPAVKSAAHRLDGPEAALSGDGFELRVGRLEANACLLDARRLDVRTGRHADLAAECAGEVAWTHVRARGERRDR